MDCLFEKKFLFDVLINFPKYDISHSYTDVEGDR